VRVELSIAALDNASDDLRFRFGEASQHPPLFTISNQHHGDAAQETIFVHVLGGSHRVEFTRGDTRIIEEVACETGAEIGDSIATLPRLWSSDNYEFRSAVRILSDDEIAEVANQLRATLSTNANAIVAQFPGHPDALTAVEILYRDDTVTGWNTWHLYPNAREVVETTSLISSLTTSVPNPVMTSNLDSVSRPDSGQQ
jgi:Protein of unknown function DUF2617